MKILKTIERKSGDIQRLKNCMFLQIFSNTKTR